MKSYTVVPEWDEEKKITINVDGQSALTPSGDKLQLQKIDGHQNLYKVSLGSKEFEAIVKANSRGVVEISIMGYTYVLKVSDNDFDSKRAILQESAVATQQNVKVTAPMPGLLKQIFAHEGQTIRKGEKLFVLEAMKMENIIKAAASGVIGRLHISEGAAVEKGSLLCTIEPLARS